jgi:hypothetical protein
MTILLGSVNVLITIQILRQGVLNVAKEYAISAWKLIARTGATRAIPNHCGRQNRKDDIAFFVGVLSAMIVLSNTGSKERSASGASL